MRLSQHCVERFHERFRPALDVIRARAELEMLIEHGEIAAEPPEWMARKMRQRSDAYLIVGDDLVLPLDCIGYTAEELVAKTCIDRGGISEACPPPSKRARPRAASPPPSEAAVRA